MSDNSTNQTSGTSQNPQTPVQMGDWREQRREERREAKDKLRAGTGGWIGGAVLILIGAAFLLQNMGIYVLQNWWALFILIPAFGGFTTAYAIYQANGRLTASARGSLIGGFFFTLLTIILLFGIDFGVYWPLLLILGGVVLLINAILPS